MWAITLRQPGPMSTDTSPLHRSHPPSQQVRPTASIRPRGLLPRWACAVLAACLALAVLAVGPHAPKADTSSITGDKDLAKQVISLLPDDYRARGIHVSVITTEGARHAGIGTAASGQQYTSTTPMEIGSITKTFTGQLLADAIARARSRRATRCPPTFPSSPAPRPARPPWRSSPRIAPASRVSPRRT